MTKGKILILFCFVISLNPLLAQYFFEIPKEENRQVMVSDISKQNYKYAWAGGMNSCQFGAVDLNLDGIKDLVVFDRHGDRLMTFLNDGYPEMISYNYAPEYTLAFPDLVDWMILKDYNNDGKEDIFAYSGEFPGIVVYKNISSVTLEFELVIYPFLTSFQGGGQVNILTTDVDYPGIEDIDGDGDLDILTFWGLGSFVEYHQNQSMELYGIPDSLEFVEVTECWGRFAESDESNEIYLDTCNFNNQNMKSTRDRHTGSTFLLFDSDDDGDQDLLLGDVDYPRPIFLPNGGDPSEAFITAAVFYFPSIENPIELFSMPASTLIDVDNDSKKDLIASPFDPSLVTSKNYKSSWLFKNIGEINYPMFQFEQNNFLQENMIDVGSGAYPVFADYDGDGLLDLFVANYGYYMYSFYKPGMVLESVYYSAIALFRNSGSQSNPQFSQVTHNFADLQKLMVTGLYPTFGDVDGDNDADMIVGQENGTLIFLENIAGTGQEMVFASPETNFQGINVGEYAAPQLYDLNADGLRDLIIGEKNGNLNYYENTGTSSNPQFTLETDSLGKINVTDPNLSYTGYSTPCFFKNQNNQTELIVGSESGKLFYYKNIDGNLLGIFVKNDSLYLLLDGEAVEFANGIRTGAAISELDNDGFYELIIGNYSGGLNYYAGIPAPVLSEKKVHQPELEIKLWPNPANDVLNIQLESEQSQVLQLQIYDQTGRIVFDQEGLTAEINRLNISAFNPGVYLVNITDPKSDRVLVRRFVKSR